MVKIGILIVSIVAVLGVVMVAASGVLQTAPTEDSVKVFDNWTNNVGPPYWLAFSVRMPRQDFTVSEQFNGYEPTGFSWWLLSTVTGSYSISINWGCGKSGDVALGTQAITFTNAGGWFTFTVNMKDFDNKDLDNANVCTILLSVVQGDATKIKAATGVGGFMMVAWGEAPPITPAPGPGPGDGASATNGDGEGATEPCDPLTEVEENGVCVPIPEDNSMTKLLIGLLIAIIVFAIIGILIAVFT